MYRLMVGLIFFATTACGMDEELNLNERAVHIVAKE